jgi:hypothetical protein
MQVTGTENVDLLLGGGLDAVAIGNLRSSPVVDIDVDLGADAFRETVTVAGSSLADTFTASLTGTFTLARTGGARVDVTGATSANGGADFTLSLGSGNDITIVTGTCPARRSA